jgi:hypothetical protein
MKMEPSIGLLGMREKPEMVAELFQTASVDGV